MNAEQIKTEVKMMKQWCEENYSNGADTMVECWGDSDYEALFYSCSGGAILTKREAWKRLKAVVSVYRERAADADYYSENW